MPAIEGEAEVSYVIAQAAMLAPISEMMIKVRTSAASICLVGTHDNLMMLRKALVTNSIVDTSPGVPFTIKVANLSLLYAQLPKGMKADQSTESRYVWLGPMLKDDKLEKVNGVQVYKATRLRGRYWSVIATPSNRTRICRKILDGYSPIQTRILELQGSRFGNDDEVRVNVGQASGPNYSS